MEIFLKMMVLFIVILNPFLLSVYLADLVDHYSGHAFLGAVSKGALVSLGIFSLFAITGEAFFQQVLGVRYGAFLIFGGLVFLLISLQFLLKGAEALKELRGGSDPTAIEGSIAIPFMVGPGTISVSVAAGARLDFPFGILAIAAGLLVTVAILLSLKAILNYVKRRNEAIIIRYYDIVGRFSSLVIGSISIDMIARGVQEIMVEMRAAALP